MGDLFTVLMDGPDASLHVTDPAYLRELLKQAGLSQRRAALKLGLNERTMRYYCAGRHEIPYVVQYAMEMAALHAQARRSAALHSG